MDDIVNFIRGYDSYDENGNANFTEERDWKLADIYHANLVLSIPPSNSDTSASEKSRAYYKKPEPSRILILLLPMQVEKK